MHRSTVPHASSTRPRGRSLADVDCPHEHDGYDPSYIMEFRMLVRDSCIRCKGTVWSDVFQHDLP